MDAMPTALFLKTTRSGFDRAVCEQALECYNAGKRVLLAVASREQARRLDNMLWTWKQECFIPHLFAEEAQGDDRSLLPQMAVVITTQMANPNGASVALLAGPVEAGRLQPFDEIIDFVVDDDDVAKAAARERFRLYRDAGFNPRLAP